MYITYIDRARESTLIVTRPRGSDVATHERAQTQLVRDVTRPRYHRTLDLALL